MPGPIMVPTAAERKHMAKLKAAVLAEWAANGEPEKWADKFTSVMQVDIQLRKGEAHAHDGA